MTGTELPVPLVSTEWLAASLDLPDVRVIDCSVVMRPTDDGGYTFVGGADEWQQGHIPGSVFVDVLSDLAAKDHPLPMMMPPAEEFANAMSRLGVSDDSRVVLYDRSNHAWAARVWWMLRYCGFERAAVLDGGWNKWVAEGHPVSVEKPAPVEGKLTVNVNARLFADKGDVVEALRVSGTCLINALSPEEHAGESSRFARAGRIPGSENVYCQSLVDPATHAFLAEDALRERFEATGALAAGRAITYCGAGIAASSDALILTLLGHADVAVYDGSLSEWANDPDVPMEKG
jgi:thiosulfate/3-mercaptopyruvate sulfurtransferase